MWLSSRIGFFFFLIYFMALKFPALAEWIHCSVYIVPAYTCLMLQMKNFNKRNMFFVSIQKLQFIYWFVFISKSCILKDISNKYRFQPDIFTEKYMLGQRFLIFLFIQFINNLVLRNATQTHAYACKSMLIVA